MIRTPLVSAVSALSILCASAPANAGVQYAYDSAGRLIRVQYSNGVTINYSYDAAGNRREITTSRIPNRSPVANNDTASTNSFAVVDIQVRDNDSDADRDALTITGVSAVNGGGTAQIIGNGTYIRYTAPAGGGVKTFTYTISDGRGGSATATVTINVNHMNRPPLVNADSVSLTASASTAVMVLANDSDPDGDALTVTGVSAPTGGSAAVAPGGGYVTYQAPSTPGAYSFTYWISDGAGGTASATVNVTVTAPPNAAPVANPDTFALEVNTSSGIMVLHNDSDPDGDLLTVIAVSAPSGGATAIGQGGGHVVYSAPTAAGTYSFTYTISDGRGGTASAPVTVSVSPPANTPPVARDDTASTMTSSSIDIYVRNNDSDVNGDPTTIIGILGVSGGGNATIINGAHIRFDAPANVGTKTFTYTISDGKGGTSSATVTVEVTQPANRPPVAVDDSATVMATRSVAIPALANDSDPDGDSLTIIAIGGPDAANATIAPGGGYLAYAAPARGVGSRSITYTVSDSRGGLATATVRVAVTTNTTIPPDRD